MEQAEPGDRSSASETEGEAAVRGGGHTAWKETGTVVLCPSGSSVPQGPLTSQLSTLFCLPEDYAASYLYTFWPKCGKNLLLVISLGLAEIGNFFFKNIGKNIRREQVGN